MSRPCVASLLAALALVLSIPPTEADASAAAGGVLQPALAALNRDLLALAAQLRRAAPEARARLGQELQALARVRREAFEAAALVEPDAVLASALDDRQRAQVPPEVHADLEEAVAAEGEVDVLAVDAGAHSRYVHLLASPGGPLLLRFARRLPALLSGDRVRVRGVRVGQTLAANGGAGGVTVVAAATSATLGEQRLLAVVVNLSDRPAHFTSGTVTQTRSLLFGASSSVGAFIHEASYGRTWLTGDVVGPFTVGMASTTCDPYGLATLAQQAAAGAGVNVGSYRRLLFVFPPSACPWGGLGTLGGSPSKAWINGGLSLGLMAHEIGHGFGLYHSHALDCGPATVGGVCTSLEYGDTLDVMGVTSQTLHFNAVQKERLGWLGGPGAPPITTVLASAAYTVAPYEPEGSAPKALKVRLANGDWYYVEYRQAIGFDGPVPVSVRSGVVVHLWQAGNPDGIYLLDMTPQTASWSDPALRVGSGFTDPEVGLTLSPVWADATGAVVNVSLPGAICLRADPVVSVTPAQEWGAPGDAVEYTVTVANRDSNCPPTVFAALATAPAGWSTGFALPTLTVAAGAATSISLVVASPGSASPATYPIGITAVDVTAPTHAASASVGYAVVGSSATFRDDFGRPDAATLGNGWIQGAGGLSVAGGEARTSPNASLQQALRSDLEGETQEAQARFALGDGPGGARVGLFVRYRDARNYYACYRSVGPNRLRIVRVQNGKERVLAGASMKSPIPGHFFTLTCRAEGSRLEASVDGRTITADDGAHARGRVGLQMGYQRKLKNPGSHRADDFAATVR